MTAGRLRDDEVLVAGLVRWTAARRPDRRDVRVDALHRPPAGWTNETVLVDLSWETDSGRSVEQLVVRVPPVVPSFPQHDLHAQARVHEVLSGAGLPVPRSLGVEDDPAWLGAPFFVMERVAGTVVGEVPALDQRIAGLGPNEQRVLHERFTDAIASVHRLDVTGTRLDAVLRTGVAAEIDYWSSYVEWATDGSPPKVLADALDWCRRTRPPEEPEPSLLWGDTRLGNVMLDDRLRIAALLDWELATLGPAEMDVAWYLALDGLTTEFVGRTVPGFLGRAQFLRRHEHRLGRALRDLRWHEVFALVRSVAINDKQARLAAAAGVPYPGVPGDDNPVLHHLARRIEQYDRRSSP